jgi:hypothetical protein
MVSNILGKQERFMSSTTLVLVMVVAALATLGAFLNRKRISWRHRANEHHAQFLELRSAVWDDFHKMIVEIVSEISAQGLNTEFFKYKDYEWAIEIKRDGKLYARYSMLLREYKHEIGWNVWPIPGVLPPPDFIGHGVFPLASIATQRPAITEVLRNNLQPDRLQ